MCFNIKHNWLGHAPIGYIPLPWPVRGPTGTLPMPCRCPPDIPYTLRLRPDPVRDTCEPLPNPGKVFREMRPTGTRQGSGRVSVKRDLIMTTGARQALCPSHTVRLGRPGGSGGPRMPNRDEPRSAGNWAWPTSGWSGITVGILDAPGCLEKKFWNVQNFRGPSRISPGVFAPE